jgi:hypothetical protein
MRRGDVSVGLNPRIAVKETRAFRGVDYDVVIELRLFCNTVDEVEVYNNSRKQVINGVEEFGDQLTWGYATPSASMQVLTITMPFDYPTQIPETGWQSTHGAQRGGKLGAWKILINGVELRSYNHV